MNTRAIRIHKYGGPEVLTFESVEVPERREGWYVLNVREARWAEPQVVRARPEAIRFLQDGLRSSYTDSGIVKLDPENDGSNDTLISEASIRSLYGHYRDVMGL